MNFMIKNFLKLALCLAFITGFNSISIAEDKPNSLTKQYRDWVYRCVNVNKKNQCPPIVPAPIIPTLSILRRGSASDIPSTVQAALAAC